MGTQAEISFPPGSTATSCPGAVMGSSGCPRETHQVQRCLGAVPLDYTVHISLSHCGDYPSQTPCSQPAWSALRSNYLCSCPHLPTAEKLPLGYSFTVQPGQWQQMQQYRPSFIQFNISFFIKVVAVTQTQLIYLRNSRARQALETSLKHP